ncbi:hypothetical protein ABE65_010245 [Fictibacillus phosphorivorans]|uniref:Uncharacterized protein n=1 Tax=Fictibacillus phosphorivorans TaxID=1221500 RepID=A0A161IIZ7_9BACL|nr:hypothetical protein [Fictibacillus phosphorivorans]ANC77159.1 hypothetical protein ABE65_010245 [Fictibacillus phosphorivorans]
MWQKVLFKCVWIVAFVGAYFIVTSTIDYFKKNAEPADTEPKISIEELEDRIIDLEAELEETKSEYDFLSSENDELRESIEEHTSSLEEVDTRVSDIEWAIFE